MTANIDPAEIAKFSALAHHWWDSEGDLRTLHALNPLRLGYLQSQKNLTGEKILDLGCGGGILAESMATVGGFVTGIDMSKEALQAAKLHRLETLTNHPELKLDYHQSTAEAWAEKHPEHYDLVTCMEMLEHVPDPASIVRAAAHMTKPGGLVCFSTLNRTPKAYLFAILGAEYLLKLLPKNTHDYAKFIKPSELRSMATDAKLAIQQITGLHYEVFTKTFSLRDDVSVNYLLVAEKRE